MASRIAFFIHPWPLLAVVVMALNDHWGKSVYPGWFTGKLSDFCGIFYFPIFLLAVYVLVARAPKGRNERPLTVIPAGLAIAFTDGLLLTVKLSAPAARTIENFFADHLFRITLVQDPSDLLALSMNVLTFWYLKKYIARPDNAKQA